MKIYQFLAHELTQYSASLCVKGKEYEAWVEFLNHGVNWRKERKKSTLGLCKHQLECTCLEKKESISELDFQEDYSRTSLLIHSSTCVFLSPPLLPLSPSRLRNSRKSLWDKQTACILRHMWHKGGKSATVLKDAVSTVSAKMTAGIPLLLYVVSWTSVTIV